MHEYEYVYSYICMYIWYKFLDGIGIRTSLHFDSKKVIAIEVQNSIDKFLLINNCFSIHAIIYNSCHPNAYGFHFI